MPSGRLRQIKSIFERTDAGSEAKPVNTSLLVLVPQSAYTERLFHSVILDTFKNMKPDGILWICTHTSAKKTRQKLEKNGFDMPKVWFIDMISKISAVTQDGENTIYCEFPSDYSAMLSYLDSAVGKIGRCIIVFDNLSAVIAYDKSQGILKVLRTMNNWMYEKGCVGIYLHIQGSCDATLETAIQSTMDRVCQSPPVADWRY